MIFQGLTAIALFLLSLWATGTDKTVCLVGAIILWVTMRKEKP